MNCLFLFPEKTKFHLVKFAYEDEEIFQPINSYLHM
jgi:hypothetical protein